MRVLFLFTIIALCWRQSAAQSLYDLVAQTPKCALPCILSDLPPADLKDVPTLSNALCSNITLLSELSVCIQQNCTWPDQIATKATQDKLCADFPEESRSTSLIILAVIFSGVAFPIVGLKLWTRWTVSHGLWADDYLVLVASVGLACLAGLDISGVMKGLGKHYWTIDPLEYTPLYKMFYSSQIIYVVIQETAKISMIFLYIRVFTSRWFTNACYMAIVFILLNGAAYIFALAFQCRPVSALWDPLLKGKGQCLNLASLSVSGAVCSIVDDLVILILPIPEIMKLKMSKNKKWGLVLMFSIGSFACITSGIRLKYLLNFGYSLDPTWDYTEVVKWSIIEDFTAVICASLPSLRALFIKSLGILTNTIQLYTGNLTGNPRDQSNLPGGSSLHSMATEPKHRNQDSVFGTRRTVETVITAVSPSGSNQNSQVSLTHDYK